MFLLRSLGNPDRGAQARRAFGLVLEALTKRPASIGTSRCGAGAGFPAALRLVSAGWHRGPATIAPTASTYAVWDAPRTRDLGPVPPPSRSSRGSRSMRRTSVAGRGAAGARCTTGPRRLAVVWAGGGVPRRRGVEE